MSEFLKILPKTPSLRERLRQILSNEYDRQSDVLMDFLYFLSMPHVAKWIWFCRCIIFGLPTITLLLLGFFVSYEFYIPGALGVFVTYKHVRGCIISWRNAKVERLLEADQLRKLALMESKLNS